MEETKLTQFSKGGGCGCKIAPSVLQQIVQTNNNFISANLLVGNESSDDAAVYRINDEEAIISTTDFFVPIVDDPFDFGRIAAANALSDVYAMGGVPLMAVAILGFPIDKLPIETAQKILEGGRSICAEAGVPLAGGHTIDSSDPIFGLAVTGRVSISNIKKNNGAQQGDLLFLSKPLGTGLLATALKRGLLQDDHYADLIKQMTTLNAIGAELGKMKGVHAMTDVTGFGLLGHALEIAEGSNVGMRLTYAAIHKMKGCEEYLKQRTIPDATFRNWNSYSSKVKFEKGVNVMEAFNLLPDPQTNGGLLLAVTPEAAAEVQELFLQHDLMVHQESIGSCTEMGEKTIVVC
ncbi:MAG: selenide, water dikinase SelD [Chitinophagaceae bacterium]